MSEVEYFNLIEYDLKIVKLFGCEWFHRLKAIRHCNANSFILIVNKIIDRKRQILSSLWKVSFIFPQSSLSNLRYRYFRRVALKFTMELSRKKESRKRNNQIKGQIIPWMRSTWASMSNTYIAIQFLYLSFQNLNKNQLGKKLFPRIFRTSDTFTVMRSNKKRFLFSPQSL